MERRTVMSGILVFLSGCSGITAPTNKRAELRKKAMNEFPYINITKTSSLQGSDAELTVEVLQQPSGDAPSFIQVTIENLGKKPLEVMGGPSPPLTSMSVQGSKTSSRLYLISENEVGVASDQSVIPEKPKSGCWRANTGFSTYEMARGATIPPGGELSRDYAVLAGPKSCLQPGKYRVTDSLSINDSKDKLSFVVKVRK